MKGEKIAVYSKVLKREFHMDEFSSKAKPKGVVLWFGGSGMTKEKYHRRGKGVVAIFNEIWNRLGEDLPIIFLFVTSPYDIEFAKPFLDSEKKKWLQHVKEDILSRYSNLPVYIIGNVDKTTLV